MLDDLPMMASIAEVDPTISPVEQPPLSSPFGDPSSLFELPVQNL
jgi:hypothetical protein